MLLSLIIIVLISCGGAAVTYLFEKDEPALWRLSAGNVIGSAVFGLAGFLLACAFGFNTGTILSAALIALFPLILLRQKSVRQKFNYDRQKAKSQFQGAGFRKFYRFLYYAVLFVILWLFFQRAMITNDGGIFTGASQNLGDLPFHLGAIFSFTDGQNFPPQNPSFAGAKFTYPFIADLIAASFVKIGASVQNAFFIQNLTLGFSLVVLLEHFVARLTKSKLAGKIAPLLLLFSGGIGFLWFGKDLWEGGKGFFDLLWHLPRDYTIFDPPANSTGEAFRWGNSLVVLFVTQRSLLFGMPLTLIVLTHLWKIFSSGSIEIQNPKSQIQNLSVGLLAGTLPLIHAHSLLVLFIVTGFLFIFRPAKWLDWIAFGAGVAILAVPALLWIMTGSATNLTQFIGWHFGWDKRNDNFLWFWLKNTGLFMPVLLAGIIGWYFYREELGQTVKGKKQRAKSGAEMNPGSGIREPKSELKLDALLFYIPFIVLFIVSNSFKLAPWEWDNIKVLIYWFVGSIPFAAWLLAWMWGRNNMFKYISAGCLIVLIAAGGLDVWRVISGTVNIPVFDREAMEIAEKIKLRTERNARFLNAPTYNSAVVLSGRLSIMRYSGHLLSHGIDYAEREADVRRIYAGDATAEIFMKKHGIDYVLIGPEERRSLTVNEEYLSKFQVVAEVGQYRVYQAKAAVR